MTVCGIFREVSARMRDSIIGLLSKPDTGIAHCTEVGPALDATCAVVSPMPPYLLKQGREVFGTIGMCTKYTLPGLSIVSDTRTLIQHGQD
jgi:hypothetical protein